MNPQDPSPAPTENQPGRAAQPNSAAPNTDSPSYGEFGGVAASAPLAANYADVAATATAPGRDGSNDNPDEFSEFRDRDKDAQKAPANPADQPGHVEQNQNPGIVQATQGEEDDIQRKAWALDDPRYAGGGSHNTRDESASTKDGQD